MPLWPRARRLGPYEIIAPLGAGGMGEVYRARDTRLERESRSRSCPTHFAADDEARARFEREAKLGLRAQPPAHLPGAYDVGQQDGTDYLVMELLDGETLAERLPRGPLPPAEALRYAVRSRMRSTVAPAGIIHRDLKPGNIMLTHNGRQAAGLRARRRAAA